MARIRTIKPEFPQSESMGRVSRDARLLFVQLWPICDDHGRTRASSRMLASLLFPYDDDAPALVDGWLAELEREQCIIRYEVDGCHFLQVLNWLKHQRIDKPSKPQYPAIEEGSRILANPREDSALEGKGREGKGDTPSAAVPAVKEPDPIFGVGLDWLVKKGSGQPIARSMLGKLRQAAHGAAGGDRDAGDLILIECIAEAMAQDVINPFPWLRQSVLARGKPAPAEHDELAWMGRKVLQ